MFFKIALCGCVTDTTCAAVSLSTALCGEGRFSAMSWLTKWHQTVLTAHVFLDGNVSPLRRETCNNCVLFTGSDVCSKWGLQMSCPCLHSCEVPGNTVYSVRRQMSTSVRVLLGCLGITYQLHCLTLIKFVFLCRKPRLQLPTLSLGVWNKYCHFKYMYLSKQEFQCWKEEKPVKT